MGIASSQCESRLTFRRVSKDIACSHFVSMRGSHLGSNVILWQLVGPRVASFAVLFCGFLCHPFVKRAAVLLEWSMLGKGVSTRTLKNVRLGPIVSGTKQWVCPGCYKRSFWTYKQCRHCQKLMPMQWPKKTTKTLLQSSCISKKNTGSSLRASKTTNKQREGHNTDNSNDRERKDKRQWRGFGANCQDRSVNKRQHKIQKFHGS